MLATWGKDKIGIEFVRIGDSEICPNKKMSMFLLLLV